MKLKYILVLSILISSCSKEENNTKNQYLGKWETSGGKTTIEIFEKEDALFIKWPKRGDVVKLNYKEDGKYYEAETAIGNMPVLIQSDTLTYSRTKYVRSSN